MFELREYQKECLDKILESYREGTRRQLICLPTGSGKTVIFSEFPGFFKMKNRMLVLAHRSELLDQAREKIIRANPGLTVEVDQANRKAGPNCDVVVASIPTLGRKHSKRLQRLDPDQFFLIIVDEAHHSTAKTYLRVLKHFGLFDETSPKLLVGFTATPKRGDGQGLDRVFQEIVYSKSLPEMINNGFLAPLAGYRVETDIDLSRVRVRMGDFVVSHLSRAVNVDRRNSLIVKVYQEHLKGKQTLCFCVDVEHAFQMADAFNVNGIQAAAITGETEKTERSKILEKFKTGDIHVLTNCMVLTEGYDEPSVQGIIIARPTRSSLLYTQMIGRGTRLYPKKKEAVIIDIVDATKEHTLSTLPEIFGFSDRFDLEGHTTQEAQEAIEWIEHERPWVRIDDAVSLSDLRYRCRKINLFDLDTPKELKSLCSFAWAATGRGAYRLPLPGRQSIVVAPTIIDKWEVVIRKRGGETFIGMHPDRKSALQRAERFVKKHYRNAIGLVKRNTAWRREPATKKQIELLHKRKIMVPEGLTKGKASHLISMLS